MKLKTAFWLVLAVVLGTAGSRVSKRLFSSTLASSHDERPPETVVVLVAREPLSAGTMLRDPDGQFEERTLTAKEAPAQAVQRLYLLRGRRLAKPIDAHAIITADCLVDEEEASLELARKEGRRAIAIAVRSPNAHFFPPQSRVDVIWTAPGAAAETRVVAQDLPLVGLEIRDGTTIATVAAKQDEAERLARAAVQGTLRLVARKSR
jgi:Flp pilus assembly protein CpaB